MKSGSGNLDKANKHLNEATKKVSELKNLIDRIAAPSARAGEEFDNVLGRYEKSRNAMDKVSRAAQSANREFLKIKKLRFNKYMENGFYVNPEFMRFWDQAPVASNIDKNTSKHSWNIDLGNYED